MSSETVVVIAVTIAVGAVIASVALAIAFVQARDNSNWREEFRIFQMENTRYLKKVHDENTRFFLSLGLTMQQIFERVDREGEGH